MKKESILESLAVKFLKQPERIDFSVVTPVIKSFHLDVTHCKSFLPFVTNTIELFKATRN